ncbi:efflux RND transporter periplasmic adaptor subunit [Falsiroseomonas sp. HW251]|uniref:HlyD family secretion protein n=1 Tax=Falsiroseomonas sp. HW251 TaxID=3390998 RepID=UPI003D3177CA
MKIAPEISGRLDRYLVHGGDGVSAGQPLAVLRSPELAASVVEARAQLERARADRNRVYAGVRQEEVDALERSIHKSEATLLLAQQEHDRRSRLVASSDATRQALDAARAEVARAEADRAMAQSQYAEAQAGPTAEERALADAQVGVAEAALAVVEARAAKLVLRAPAEGTVALLVPEVGESVVPGEPVLTLLPVDGVWFSFNIREDRLGRLSIGAPVELRIPGRADPVSATLSELRNWGEFAVWRAARAAGDHDLNTLLLRFDPARRIHSAEAGQTVLIRPVATEESR